MSGTKGPNRLGPLRSAASLLSESPVATARALLLMVALALTEGVGLLFLLPLLQRAGVTGGGVVSSNALDRLTSHLPRALGMLLLVYVGVIGVRALLEVAESQATAHVESHVVLRLRECMYRALVRARWEVLARLRGARIAHVLTQEFERVGIATNHLMRGALEVLMVATYAFAALVIAPAIGLVASACALVLLAVLRTQQRAMRDDAGHISELGEQIFTGATEHIAALKSAKAADAGERLADRFVVTARAFAHSWIVMQRRSQVSRATMSIGAAASLSVIVLVAVNQLHMPAAALLVLLFVYARLVARLGALQQTILVADSYLPSLVNVQVLLHELAEAAEESHRGAVTPMALTRTLRFENVSFQYPGTSRPALRSVSCTVSAGRVTAVTGVSGAGKSTLADLALLLLLPQSGTLLVDGMPLNMSHAASWRAAVSYLPQDAQLFHDTVRENVRWLVPGASDSDVEAALRQAGGESLVRRLPKGLDTVVGDRGALLSGGERQRVALARAMLRRPSFLLLDEATSSLDAESEGAIQATLRGLAPVVTVMIITHRLASARRADHVIVIDDGEVAGEGRWDELVAAPSSRLSRLWETHTARR